MDVLEQSFLKSIEIVNNLKKTPSKEELLIIYSLFKQSKFGNNTLEQPSFLYIKERAKWEAWNKLNNMNQNEAKQQYITLAVNLFKKYN